MIVESVESMLDDLTAGWVALNAAGMTADADRIGRLIELFASRIDDDRPVTPGWLEMVGYTLYHGYDVYDAVIQGGNTVSVVVNHHGKWWIIRVGGRGDVVRDKPFTRGEIRDLCQLLGITLSSPKEKSAKS